MFKKILLVFALLLSGRIAWSQEFPPKPNTLVADFTNTLSQSDKDQLERKLVAFDDSTSTQVAIAIIKSVGEYDIDEYGTLLGRNWGIGQNGKNNGVLILVALNDHKVTIQTGYGMEGALPDAVTQEIIQRDMRPRFKQGDYYGGLDAATDDIIKATKGEFKADPNYHKQRRQASSRSGGAGFVIFIVIFILIIIFRNRGGGGGQIIGRRGSASPFWWFLAGSMLGGGRRGGDWGGFSGGGGGWGGGNSGGGGGFGGFGGGSFGGGGSSGSW